jgi:hypothetical protein
VGHTRYQTDKARAREFATDEATDKTSVASGEPIGMFDALKQSKTCSNLACATEPGSVKLLDCPCKRVSYCGRECQRAHYNTHRPECSATKPKKKKKKKKKQQPGK